VVVLPELDAYLSGRNGSLLYERASPLEAVQTVVRPPPPAFVDTDATLSAMKAQIKNSAVVESLSVLYVALTRAKYALYMLMLPERGKEATPKATFAGHLYSACAGGGAATPGTVLYQVGSLTWTDQFKLVQDQEKPQVQPRPVKLKPVTSRTRLLPRQSPSALEGAESGDVARLLSVDSPQARARGTLLHRYFQEVSWLSKKLPQKAALKKLALEAGFSAEAAEEAGTLFDASLGTSAIAALFDEKRYRAWPETELWRERSFALRDGQRVLSGTFDRVVIGRSGKEIVGAEIIDFKSDDVSGGNLAVKVDFYRPQLEAYCTALSHLIGIPRGKIKATLAFVNGGQVVEL
jgi:ATP-dependent helicase/nuclease subunit A